VYFDETLLWFGFTFVSLFTASPLMRSVNSSLIPPLYPHCSTSTSHLQEVGDVTVLTSTSRLPLLYIQKNCVISLLFVRKNSAGRSLLLYILETLLSLSFSATIIQGMLWVRTKNSEQLMWPNDTSRNDASSIIIHCFIWAIYRDQKKLTILTRKQCIR
jgi:hypothetical protein